MNWLSNTEKIFSILRALSVSGSRNQKLEIEEAFNQWLDITVKIREERKTIYLIGNGASASMASHMAADLSKNGHLHTQVFSDLSLITAIANDLSYEEVFAEPLRRRMSKGDMLVAISSSGQSPNIVRAVEVASNLGGTVITLTAMQSDNILQSLGILNYYIPAKTYGLAESCHAIILHHWMDLVSVNTNNI